MLRPLLAAFLAVLGSPVLAQSDEPIVDLFAKALIGFADGATIDFSTMGFGTPAVRQISPGVFAITGPDKKRALYTFSEHEPCVVTVVAKLDPPQPGGVRVDLRLVKAITIEPKGSHNDIPSWELTMETAEGGFTVVTGDRTDTQTTSTSTINTTIPREEMEAAAAELLSRCAGIAPAGSLTDASPVDLLAMIFAGVADGKSVEMNGLRGPVVKEFDGLYRIKPATGEPEMKLSIRQQGRCQFLFVAGQEGDREFSAMLNADLISGISVVPEGERLELSAFKVTIDGDEGRLKTKSEDGWETVANAESYLTTSFGIGDIESAIEAFRTEYCPGLAG